MIAEGSGILTDYNPIDVKIKIKNYLSTARRLKINITALSKYLSISTEKINIGTLNEMETDSFTVKINLLESTPWYEGKVDILLEFDADDYTDYQLVQLPLLIDTKNKYSLNYVFPETAMPLFLAALTPRLVCLIKRIEAA